MIGSDESSQHFGQYVESAPLVVCQDVDRICLAEYRFCFSSNFYFQIAGLSFGQLCEVVGGQSEIE